VRNQIADLSQRLNLTYYQVCVLEHNFYKYDMGGLVKKGGILYAPYQNDEPSGFYDLFVKIIRGRRADLIGADRILIYNQRGIHVYTEGCCLVRRNGKKYHLNAFGDPICCRNFIRVI